MPQGNVAPSRSPRSRLARLLLGRPEDPAWARPVLLGIIAAAAVLYTWSLDRVGYGNTYYAAAAASGADSWKAWFFGSFDSAGFITVEKLPGALWLTGLLVRLFGLSPWSILLPEVLAGVAAVAVLYATVRRWFGAPAGLLAAGAMALTPVVVVMSRHNNPDALLVLLTVGAAALTLRAVESGRLRWVLAASGLAGFGFLVKTTQALLILPALSLTYLVAAPIPIRRRVAHLAAGFAVFVVAVGWWIAAVQLVPAPSRPYVGGTDTNSVLEYALLGYNGLDRLLGEGSSSLRDGAWGGGAGWTRLFNDEVGGQVSWLIPLAVTGLAAGLWQTRRRGRTDLRRAGWLLWGTLLLTNLVVLSLMSGIFHPYYTMTLAPPVAALAGAGAVALWRSHRAGGAGAWLLPAAIAVTAAWAWALLRRTPDFAPGLGLTVLVVGALAAAALVLFHLRRSRPALSLTAAAAGLAVLLAGPAAYAVETVGNVGAGGLGGGNPTAGPTTARPAEDAADAALAAYLMENRGDATWLAATDGHSGAAALILATGEPVMAMGGWNGGDPTPTTEDLAGFVAGGQLRFVLLSAGSGSLSTGLSRQLGIERTAWVEAACAAVEVAGYAGSAVLYDCAPPSTFTST